MAKKDFDNYFNIVSQQYQQFKTTLEQVAKDAQDNPTDIDFLENLKKQIQPFQQNYERLLYIKFLLDQPARKRKVPRYKEQLRKVTKKLDKKNSLEAVVEENQEILNHLT